MGVRTLPFLPVWLLTPCFYDLSYHKQPTSSAKPICVTTSSSVHCGCCCAELVGPAKLKSKNAGDPGYRNLRWAGLGEGRMSRVWIHRPLHAAILARQWAVFKMLMNRWEEVSGEDSVRQGWFISSFYVGKVLDITSEFRGEMHKTFQRAWDVFQKSKVLEGKAAAINR